MKKELSVASKTTTQHNVQTISKEERSEVVSSFSIRSVYVKTEATKNTKVEIIDPNLLPREDFSQEDFFKHWELYIQELLNKGERIQAATLTISTPILKGNTIHLEVPNKTTQQEIIKEETKILGYLHRALRNYDILLEVTENEEIAKRILVTPEDKYERLLELNPLLKEFRKELDLNLGF
ncbi:MAG: DNA polymerase III subunit gamma/tau [Capnocytophaga sp.]|nr:DNA polymerase III subunit gamma/tau [Capnocytophaga sp.]